MHDCVLIPPLPPCSQITTIYCLLGQQITWKQSPIVWYVGLKNILSARIRDRVGAKASQVYL